MKKKACLTEDILITSSRTQSFNAGLSIQADFLFDQGLILQFVTLHQVCTQIARYGITDPWIFSKEKYSPL